LDSDADISETASGDHQAFERIVIAHQDRVFAHLGRMGLDSRMAEGLAGDIAPIPPQLFHKSSPRHQRRISVGEWLNWPPITRLQ
jgi:hypothetical protein